MLLLAAGRQRRQRAAVECALESDDAIALRLPIGGVILARDLDRALHRLGARIAEEHEIGEALRAQPLGQPFPLGHAVEVGHVPDLAGLFGQRRDQSRVAVSEHVHGHAGGEIEVALAVVGGQPSAVAPLEGEVGARISRHQARRHFRTIPSIVVVEMNRAASPGGTTIALYWTAKGCQHGLRVARSACRHRLGGHWWGKHGWESADSCARVLAYCSLVAVEYDISCGGLYLR
jgi:hypothetical protein